jgi:hypothetical protein
LAASPGNAEAEFALALRLLLTSRTEEGMERLTGAAAAGVERAAELLQQIKCG